MNIYDKWIDVSVIKLMMHMRYRLFLEAEVVGLAVYFYICLFVDVDMVTKNGCSYVLSCIKMSKNIVKTVNRRCA